MAKHDAFGKEFKKLLERLPDDYSLAQFQYDYRQVIYLMGMQILERFPVEVIGRDPSGRGGGKREHKSAGGQAGNNWAADKGGPHPSLCNLACLVLSVQPPD